MGQFKRIALPLFRWLLTFLAVLVAYVLGSMTMNSLEITMTPEQERQAAAGLIWVAAGYTLVFSFLLSRARWYGLTLVAALYTVFFGVETFMSQIETVYFNRAVQMEPEVIRGIVVAGAVRAALFSVLAVPIYAKLRRPVHATDAAASPLSPRWGWRIAALAVFYATVYIVFGYFVAWQWEETRLYYTGSTEIVPFFAHLRGLVLADDPWLLPFQLVRGVLWSLLALLIVRMIRATRWEKALATGLTFAVLLSLPLASFPNPYMPAPVAESHFYEIFSSMLLFGAVAGWVLAATTDAHDV